MTTQVKVEFTVEPFVEGELAERVTATVSAVESMGVVVDVGPFGSSFVTGSDTVGEVIARLVATAYRHGATHVNIDTEIVS